MLILQDILSQEIVQRLGWTLLHFIWQAAAVALILAVLLKVLRKSTANLRYIIACLALALIVLMPVITIKLVPVSQPLTAAHIAPTNEPTMLPIEEMPAPETIVIAQPYQPESVNVLPAIPFKQRMANTLEPALPYIVSGWLIGVFGLSIWHLGGWTQLQRLKRRMVRKIDSTLLNKLKVLIQKLNVKQTVQLMESALVQIPTVVGWLKPVILLPTSAITGLSTEQLEAIIAHELAHIKRFDYLLNILQTVVEILGFYHPAVWWVSHKIRAERENCCDDMAVSISGDRLSYAGALASMEEIRAAGGKLAVAATGGNLFRRICRLLGKDSTENTGLSWVPAATAILLIIALAIPTSLALNNKSKTPKTTLRTDNDKFSPITYTGRIVDSKGNAVASATVEAYETYFDKAGNLKLQLIGKSMTKDDGKFSFKTTPTVKKSRSDGGLVIAQKEGLAIGWANWPLYDGNQKAKIILQEPTKLSGKIVDDNGKPVPSAEVRAVLFEDKTIRDGNVSWLPGIRPSDCLSAHTDRNGRFEFDNIPHNVTSDFLVTAPGFGTFYSRKPNRIDKGYEWAEFKAGQTDIRITISPEAGIEGKLVNEKTGKGVAGITLRVIPNFTSVFFERYLCTTKEDGTFSIGGLRSGKYVILRAGSRNLKVGVEVESGKTKRNVILKYPYDIRNSEPQTNKTITPNLNEQKSDRQIEDERVLSADKLKKLGLAVVMYANDHDNKLPDTLEPLKPYIANEQDYLWLHDNVEYVLKEIKYQQKRPNIPVAYDKTLKEQQSGTNVLFLDGHEEFLPSQRLNELGIKRAEILIDAMFLSVSEDFLKNINLDVETWDMAQSNLTPEKLKSLGVSKTGSLILNNLDVNLVLSAVKIQKDSKILAHPKVLTREGTTAEIITTEHIPILTGYTEPNNPSEKPKPKFDQVDTGFSMSLMPKLTPDKNIDIQFELEIAQISGFEEKMYKGKYPYKLPMLQRIVQSTRYIAKDGQTLLFGGNEIADRQDGQTEQKDLLILIKASTIDSSKQDKPAKTENLVVTAPPTTTTTVATQPVMVKSKTQKPTDNEQKKTKADQTVTEIFEIRHSDPVEIVEVLKKLINGRPDTASVIKPDTASFIESNNGPILLVPEPKRKWIIAKASPENINQIGQWIKKLDTNKSTIGLDPMDKAVHEQLEMIVDLSVLAPQMSFAEVIEILENSVEPPLQIQPIWKDLLDNAEVEQATPAGMDPLPNIKLRKAMEILLTSVSSTGMPKLTYIVDEGVILIGTKDVLPPKMPHRVYDISDPNELRKTTEHKQQPSQLQPKIAKLPDESKKRMTPLEQVQKQLDELIKQQQAPKVTEPNLPMDPNVLLISNTFIDCPLIDALKYIAAATNVTIIPDENIKGIVSCTLKDVTIEKALDIVLAGTPYIWKKTPHYYLVASGVEQSKMVHRVYDISDLVFESANYRMLGNRSMKMGGMGGMINDQDGYMRAQNFVRLIQETIEPDSWHDLSDTGEGTIMAYPMQSSRKLAVMQTNKVHQEIEKLLNAKRESLENQVSISIGTVFLSVSDDFLKDVGLDTNPEKFSDAWREHLAATYPASPNGQTYGLILDDLQVRFLLRAVQAHHDSKAIVAPRVHTRAGTTAEMRYTTEEYNYISSYNESQEPSVKPQPEHKKVDIGTRIWLTPKLDANNRNLNVDLKLEITQLEGIIEGKYKEKYPYYKPIIDVISANMPCTIPDGKTMLIGGLKINEHVPQKTRTSGLKDLPLIGAAFSSKDKTNNQKMLLILVKPIINPNQKAAKAR
ncbi:MAG: M56 family metallopeptidase [Sedimentisphaerales bacterium]|nr:M56 family metallopeptidase [Sedimentisphaerales bacterium]